MEVSVELVKDLRQRTGAGVVDCKKALQEAKGNVEAAIDYLYSCPEVDNSRFCLMGFSGGLLPQLMWPPMIPG